MPPKFEPDARPELDKLDKLDIKPVLEIEPDIMAEVNLPCTVKGCNFKTGDLGKAVAASVLSTHTTTNLICLASSNGRCNDRLKKLDWPILTTGCSQQDFGFFKDEWRRYCDAADTNNDSLLQDQLLQCAKTSLRKTLKNTIGATNFSCQPDARDREGRCGEAI